MSQAQQVSHEFQEDASEQAGWMYADLFLALMVLFLATISFVPDLTKLPQTPLEAKAAVITTGPQFIKGASEVYDTFDAAKIAANIHAFEAQQHYPLNSQVLYAQIIGGYGPNQNVGDGSVTAIGFGIKLKAQLPAIFATTDFSISTNSNLPSGSVLLRMTFVPAPIGATK